jgi:hypothetical protein
MPSKNILWTRESVFCLCSHHIEMHDYDSCNVIVDTVGDTPVYCRCRGFRSYRVLKGGHKRPQPQDFTGNTPLGEIMRC